MRPPLPLLPFVDGSVQLTESLRAVCTEYLKKIAALNQLVAVAQQLRRDALSGASQKYLAHQMALLYVRHRATVPTRVQRPAERAARAQHCLGQTKSASSRSFKKRIEAKFDHVKAVTEDVAQGPDEPTHAWCAVPHYCRCVAHGQLTFAAWLRTGCAS